MRLGHVRTSASMTMKECARNRFALVLLFVIPTLFCTLVSMTTSERALAFELASVGEGIVVEVSARRESLIFIGVACVGLLTSFLALSLIQKDSEANRRLVLCGYRAAELVVAKLTVLMGAVLLIAVYVASILLLWFTPRHFLLVVLGLVLAGFVHACYGLLVGSFARRDLEGVLLIVLLVNIDAGWLQNPVYYAEAQNHTLIRSLPAYFCAQATMVAAFTDHSVGWPFVWGLLYGAGLLGAALIIVIWKTRITRTAVVDGGGTAGG